MRFALYSYFLFVCLSCRARAVDMGEVVDVEGSAYLFRADAVQSAGPLRVDTRILSGDNLSTFAASYATIDIRENRILQLGPNTVFVLAGPSESGTVGLLVRGEARILNSNSLVLHSPAGLVRLAGHSAVRADSAGLEVRAGKMEILRTKEQATARQKLMLDGAIVTISAEKLAVDFTLPVAVISLGGGVETQSASGEASPLGDRLSLLPGERLQTAKGAQVRLGVGSDSSALLREKSEVLVVRDKSNSNGVAVALRSGDLKLEIPEASSESITLSLAGSPLAVSPTSDGASVRARATDSGPEIEVVRGMATYKGRTLAAGDSLASGDSKSSDAKDVRPAEPEADIVVTRAEVLDLRSKVFPLSVTLRPGGGQRAQLSSRRTFRRLIADAPKGGHITTSLRPGEYYFRYGRPGQWRNGVLRVSKGSPDSPNALAGIKTRVEDTGANTTLHFATEVPAVTFSWAPRVGAKSYRLALFAKGSLSRPLFEKTMVTEFQSVPANTLGEGDYLWSVTALSETGSPLKAPRLNSLRIAFDNSVSSLLLDATRTDDNLVRVSGVAPNGARLFADNQPLPLDGSGRFDGSIRGAGDLIAVRIEEPSKAPRLYAIRPK